ncbi:MAG: FAD-binding oxidoreductase [Chloroflexia bacterium]|nr:FAD-binding oxidoreductase [Chloroflexia bacterium]
MRFPRGSDRADVAIIGGGIVGLSLAWYLRKLGVERVTLVERGEPGQQSTGAASGGIRRQFGTRVEIEMTLAGWRFYEEVLSHSSYTDAFDQAGYAFLAGPRQIDALGRAWMLQQEIGLPVRWLGPAELAEMFPYCELHGLVGGTFCGEDGFIDPPAVVQWLLRQCRAQGVHILEQTPVDAVTIAGRRIRTIRSGRTIVAADAVVNAAGAWAGCVGTLAGVNIPVEPSPRVKYVTDSGRHFSANSPLIIDLPTGTYVRLRQGGAILGVKPKKRVVSFNVETNQRIFARMARRVCERFPGLHGAKLRGLIKGLYELTPDGLPLGGPVAGVTGLYVIAGFNGHGIMHGPGVARALAELIVMGKSEALDLGPLRPDRFERHIATKHYNFL